MEDVGVRAVVENTQAFMSDIKKVNKSVEGFAETVFDLGTSIGKSQLQELGLGILDVKDSLISLGPAGIAAGLALKLLGGDIIRLGSDIKRALVGSFNLAVSTIKFFGNAIKKLASAVLAPFKAILSTVAGSLRRVGEIASGILIANTIRKLADTISGMASSALEAAINFQTLEVRLKGLAARQILNEDGVVDFGTALEMASERANDLLDWVVQLSLKAPISRDAIANTLTMATSYGLGADKAKEMTEAVLNFSSGMGLSDVAMRRIIENFGQMIQQGKITSMELRDMGRGAFVPVNDLLNKTAELLGMTADEFDGTAGSINAFADKAGLDQTMVIMEAFITLVDEEFQGAMERMGRTIQGLRERFKNLTGSILGLNVLKPSLDRLGSAISEIFDAIADSDRIQELSSAIGIVLEKMVGDLLGEMPTVEAIVSKIEEVMENIAVALFQIRGGNLSGALATLGVPQSFIDFIEKIKNFTVPEKLTEFIENVTTAFTNLKDFWNEHGETIMEALRVAAGDIFEALGLEDISLEGGGFAEWTENLDVAEIVQKIDDIATSIVEFIEAVQSIPETIETVKPYFPILAALFFGLRYPILSFLAVAWGILPVLATILGKMVAKITEAEWFQAGADAMAKFLNGLTEGWKKVWAWAVEQWNKLKDLFSGIPGWGGGGPNSTTQPAPGSGFLSLVGTPKNTTNITNNNLTMNPRYSESQSPARIRDDVSILLNMAGP